MMALTPETLVKHELNGLAVTVVDDPDGRTGIAGTVVEETTKTLRIEHGDRSWVVPKQGASFEFTLPAGGRVVVDGAQLVARPARRTESAGGSKWRSA